MSTSTGASISSKKSKAFASKRSATSQGVVLDGIIYQPAAAHEQPAAADKVGSRQPAQQVHWRASRSMALMRQAVTAPKQKPAIKSDIKRGSKPATKMASRFGFSLKADSGKAQRASAIERSNKISRFGASMGSISKPDLAPTVTKISAKVRAVASMPMAAGSLSASAQPSASLALSHPAPALPGNISSQRLEAMLDRALQQADAHKQILSGRLKGGFWRKLGKARIILLAIGLVMALALGLAYAYLKVPAFSVKVASVAAGVDARAPAYVPPGYSLSSTSFKSGVVTLTFTNGGSSFSISQQKSGLNEEGLRSSVVTPASKLYQASQYNGVTVYTYGDSATWVNQGVKTTVTNGQALNSDQKAKIIEGSL